MHSKTLAVFPFFLAGQTLVAAHMQMVWPPPLKSIYNPNTPSGSGDYSMTSPLSASGSDFPCKGYQSLLETDEGAPVTTFKAGSKYNFTIAGGAYHDGGSCQASLSYDNATTFTVIQSWVGNCPLSSGGSFDFTVPSDTPSGTRTLFAWTWFNEVGNREMYMNCASVDISGSSSSRVKGKRDDVAFSDRPAMFVANVGNGCGTVDSTDVIFPNPGPNVIDDSSKSAAPTGSCATASGSSGSSPSSTAAASPTSAKSSTALATPSANYSTATSLGSYPASSIGSYSTGTKSSSSSTANYTAGVNSLGNPGNMCNAGNNLGVVEARSSSALSLMPSLAVYTTVLSALAACVILPIF